MKKTNKKGFTLIELLAVIVILSIIIIMAVASVGAVLNRMKKNAYVVEANTIVKAVKETAVTNSSILPVTSEKDSIILLSDIELQSGTGTKSPYGSAYDESSYVKIVKGSTVGVYTYSICIVDENGNGIEETNIDNVSNTSVTTGVECSSSSEESGGNDASTILLLHGNNDLTDSSANTKSITNDNLNISSSVYKFGNSSIYFNGNSTAYINYGTTNFSNFQFGAGDLTIDFWMNAESFNSGTTLMDQWGYGGSYSWILLCASGQLTFYYSNDGNNITGITSQTVLSTGTWYHIAIVRNSGTLTLYINGAADISDTISGSIYFPEEELNIGRNGGAVPSNTYTGYMDEIRFSNVARWTSDFTPPTKEYS